MTFPVALLASWVLRPAAEALFRDQTAILTDQIRGNGCQFQDPGINARSLNPLPALAIRHQELACPMWAATLLSAGTPPFLARGTD